MLSYFDRQKYWNTPKRVRLSIFDFFDWHLQSWEAMLQKLNVVSENPTGYFGFCRKPDNKQVIARYIYMDLLRYFPFHKVMPFCF